MTDQQTTTFVNSRKSGKWRKAYSTSCSPLHAFVQADPDEFACNEKAGAGITETFAAIKFEKPFEAMVTLEQIAEAFEKFAKVTFQVTPALQNASLSRTSNVYIRNASTLLEAIEQFMFAAKLAWRISADGSIELHSRD